MVILFINIGKQNICLNIFYILVVNALNILVSIKIFNIPVAGFCLYCLEETEIDAETSYTTIFQLKFKIKF